MRNAHTPSEIDMQQPELEYACTQVKTVDKIYVGKMYVNTK